MGDTYYGSQELMAHTPGSLDRPMPILAKLKMQRERVLENLKTLDNAIAMLEQHPEFADFTDIMNKAGRI
jgi:uncharacterized membrane protein YfbV (UPF0208 family)